MSDTSGTHGRPHGARRIVVGYDGSDPSVRALRFALGTLSAPDGEVWVVHAALAPSTVAEPRTDEEQGTESGAIDHSLRALEAEVDPAGRRVHVWTRDGAPAPTILAAAEEVRADLIVLGTRGLRGASRLLLGSVSIDVVRHARCPVTVVP